MRSEETGRQEERTGSAPSVAEGLKRMGQAMARNIEVGEEHRLVALPAHMAQRSMRAGASANYARISQNPHRSARQLCLAHNETRLRAKIEKIRR